MQFRVLATFNYRAPDGSAKRAAKNALVDDLPPDAIEGLSDEGWIEPANDDMATRPPETQAMTRAPETKALPEGWRDLNAADMKELARSLSGGELFGTKADAEEYLSDLED